MSRELRLGARDEARCGDAGPTVRENVHIFVVKIVECEGEKSNQNYLVVNAHCFVACVCRVLFFQLLVRL